MVVYLLFFVYFCFSVVLLFGLLVVLYVACFGCLFVLFFLGVGLLLVLLVVSSGVVYIAGVGRLFCLFWFGCLFCLRFVFLSGFILRVFVVFALRFLDLSFGGWVLGLGVCLLCFCLLCALNCGRFVVFCVVLVYTWLLWLLLFLGVLVLFFCVVFAFVCVFCLLRVVWCLVRGCVFGCFCVWFWGVWLFLGGRKT